MAKSTDIRTLSADEIRNQLNDAREELMKLRFQRATGELTDTSRLRQVRRQIAQLLTALSEQERAG